MYFTRMFGSALNTTRRDPRDKIFAEFKCALCGETSEIDITTTQHTFDFERERRCKHCGQIDANDKALNLKAQLEKLTDDKSRIEVQIEKVIRELDELGVSTSATDGSK